MIEESKPAILCWKVIDDGPPASHLKLLSQAELQVATCVRQGLRTKEIATVLRKSPSTVKAQIASIMKKTGLHNRSRLVAWLNHVPFPT